MKFENLLRKDITSVIIGEIRDEKEILKIIEIMNRKGTNTITTGVMSAAMTTTMIKTSQKR